MEKVRGGEEKERERRNDEKNEERRKDKRGREKKDTRGDEDRGGRVCARGRKREPDINEKQTHPDKK